MKSNQTTIPLPKSKVIYGYKKLQDGRIAYLRIPKRAKRVRFIGSNKCRAERAVILKIVDKWGHKVKYGQSIFYPTFWYFTGKTVHSTWDLPSGKVRHFNDCERQECAAGIHFFLTLKEAKQYWR